MDSGVATRRRRVRRVVVVVLVAAATGVCWYISLGGTTSRSRAAAGSPQAPLYAESDWGVLTSTERPDEIEGATLPFVVNKAKDPIQVTGMKVETEGAIDIVDVRLRDSDMALGEERDRLMKEPPGVSLSISTRPVVPVGARRGLVVYSKLKDHGTKGPGRVVAVTLHYKADGKRYATRYTIGYVLCPGPEDEACRRLQNRSMDEQE